MDEKGPTVAAFLRAIDRAEQLIVSDSGEVERLLALYEEAMDPATLEALIPIIQAQVSASPQPTESGFEKAVDFHLQTGLLDDAPAFADIIPADWIETALKGKTRTSGSRRPPTVIFGSHNFALMPIDLDLSNSHEVPKHSVTTNRDGFSPR